MPSDPLELFLPPVAAWFREALGTPTPVQREGWPRIARGESTLMLAPTGSGKTLAAFLACLDHLWRQPQPPHGVQVLYVSPLKALNNDVYRNLQVPLEGVGEAARRMGHRLPQITVGLRTGDTPSRERQMLTRRPPHVLITTPESLHLLLTSQAARTLHGVRYCIVDEIHAVCANKRGVFLALLLERLQTLIPHDLIRVGLSATQRPLEEVARYLGGLRADGTPRPVSIVDAGLRKNVDLQVVSPVDRFGPMPEKSIWPAIYRLLRDLIGQHRSTIIFANNRRTAERITTELNELVAEEPEETLEPRPPLARAHHGSVSLEVRQGIEKALKEGRLPAVVATASLELGIDMGAVDLVCQVESSGNVARGLQRVGRAGHLVGETSKGRFIPKTLPDLLEQAVLAREMLAGRVEAIKVPTNCLDVLAQQIVAIVAMGPCKVPDLYQLVRQAYPYRDLSPVAFESVLEMVSGRYPSDAFRDLRPRISWDRVHNQLHALPGSQHLALINGGTIPDTGQYAAYVDGQDVRIGELDEEFVYERRIGDTFVLGTTAWRIAEIGSDRVLVQRVEGVPAMMPFWRGERAGRTPDLGVAIGSFLQSLLERLPKAGCQQWLKEQCHLDDPAARNLRDYVRRQVERAGSVPTDRTILVEAFRDQVGDWHVAILSPLGSRFHLVLRLALEAALLRRYGYLVQALHHDDGLLLRLPDVDEPPLDLLESLDLAKLEEDVLQQLGDSALFAIRFRHNAMRALLMPRGGPDRRAPLWLQRLKARNLLQIARQHPSFPVVVETFRECLQDHLDLPRLQQLLADVQAGKVEVVTRRAEQPSPFAASLLFNFQAAFMYDYDREQTGASAQTTIDKELLDHLVQPERFAHLIDQRAVQQVERRLRGLGFLPRTVDEMAEWLRRIGDVAPTELEGPMPGFLAELERQQRVTRVQLKEVADPERWILAEEAPTYVAAFAGKNGNQAAETILRRFLDTHALVGLEDVQRRYPFPPGWLHDKMQELERSGQLIALPAGTDQPEEQQWSAPANLEQVQRGSLALQRSEVLTVAPHQFADFLLHWQHRHPRSQLTGSEGLRQVLQRLEGLGLPAELWEQTVLPSRIKDYQTRWLDELGGAGEWLWASWTEEERGAGDVAFHTREHLAQRPSPWPGGPDFTGDQAAERTLEALRQGGAAFVVDLVRQTGLPPSQTRGALWRMLRKGVVTNDRFDVVRRGEEAYSQPIGDDNRNPGRGRRRMADARPEGRWSLVPWGMADTETRGVQQVHLLLDRYGIVARELAQLDPSLLPWRVLYEVLSRMEWAGQVRRGYFIEGLSGAQFGDPDAVAALQKLMPKPEEEPVILLHSQDPANVYGSGLPFDLPFAALRRNGNWLALRGGQPKLWFEQNSRRITTLPSARPDDLTLSAATLPGVLRTGLGAQLRGKLVIDSWDGQPVTQSAGREPLEAAGFVRDYQAMTLYAGWS